MKYKLSQDIAVKIINDELFILDRSISVLHSFNETGKFLWQLIQGGVKVEELGKRLCAEFSVDAAQADEDAISFINDSRAHTSCFLPEIYPTPEFVNFYIL